jgi:hypothetical protein
MRTGSPISPVARPTATLVALAVALSSAPVVAHAQGAPETLPTPVRVEGTHGPVPLAVPPDAPPPVLHADTTTTVTTTTTSVALAQGGVTLRDGRILSGTIVQVASGQQVILDTPDGQRHIIPWDQVADLRYAAPAAVVAPVAPGPGRPTLHVELTRPGNVRLYEIGNQILVAPSMNWGSYAQAQQAVALCTAPCDRTIDASRGQSYFFAGDRITPLAPLHPRRARRPHAGPRPPRPRRRARRRHPLHLLLRRPPSSAAPSTSPSPPTTRTPAAATGPATPASPSPPSASACSSPASSCSPSAAPASSSTAATPAPPSAAPGPPPPSEPARRREVHRGHAPGPCSRPLPRAASPPEITPAPRPGLACPEMRLPVLPLCAATALLLACDRREPVERVVPRPAPVAESITEVAPEALPRAGRSPPPASTPSRPATCSPSTASATRRSAPTAAADPLHPAQDRPRGQTAAASDLWVVGIGRQAPIQLTSTPGQRDAARAGCPTVIKFLFLAEARRQAVQVWRGRDRRRRPRPSLTSFPARRQQLQPQRRRQELLAFSADVFPDCDAADDPRLHRRSASRQRKTGHSSGQLYTRLFVRHWDTWKDGRRSHLFVWPIDGSRNPVDISHALDADVPSKPFGDSRRIHLQPRQQADRLLRPRRRQDRALVDQLRPLRRARSTAPRRPVNLTRDNPAWDTGPVFSPDGKTLAYRAMKPPRLRG